MSDPIDVRVPDIGDFDEVEVVEVHVAVGDTVEVEGILITLESDKASLDVPSPVAGTVVELAVSSGALVAEDSLIARIEALDGSRQPEASGAAPAAAKTDDDAPGATSTAAAPAAAPPPAQPVTSAPAPAPPPAPPATSAPASPAAGGGEDVAFKRLDELPAADIQAEVLVLGSGPGGYTAAFRAADLGKKVVLVERDAVLGGVCLNVGCIPSKAMLHAAAVLDEAAEFADRGIDFGQPSIDLVKLAAWKDGVVERLTKGLAQLAKKRKVTVVQGTGTFQGPHELSIEHDGVTQSLAFSAAIVAAGSRPVMVPGFPADDERLWTSDDAIRVPRVPKRLLVIGGGIIGLEMAQIYSSLGSAVTVVELLPGLMPGADRDLVRPLERRIGRRYENIFTATEVTGIKPLKKGLKVAMKGDKAPESDTFDAVLVAVGRRPNGDRVGAEAAGIRVDERGFLRVDAQQRTNVGHIFAIGDLTGNPMLAHKATHEGKVAAEVIAGQASAFDATVIPSVAYTDPEVAWVGLTEEQALEQGVEVEKGAIPWAASGRALGMGRIDGLTKLLFDAGNGRLLGAGIVGPHAGDLIAEAALAIEMGSTAGDIGLTVHPHPTLSETLAFAAEAVEGTITDLYLPKR